MIDVHNLNDVTAQDHPATWQIKHERSWVSDVDIVPICLFEAMWAWLNVNAVGVRGWPLHTSYLAVHYFFGLHEFFGGVARRKASWRWFDNSDIILMCAWGVVSDYRPPIVKTQLQCTTYDPKEIRSYSRILVPGWRHRLGCHFWLCSVLASESTDSVRLTDINLCRRPQ